MFFQQLLNGITLGAAYALIALGYTMVYGIITLINFAHGEIFMVGAFVGLALTYIVKANIFISLLGAMLACMVLGIVVERVAYRPLRRSSRLSALISAIGVSIFLATLVQLIRGPQTTNYPAGIIANTVYNFASIQVSKLQLVMIVVSALLMLGLQLIVKYTKIGKAMRATAQDYDAASLMGININRVISFTFALGSALAAAGGVLVGIYFNAVGPFMGLSAGLKAFAAAVLGGIGSIPGAMLGGILLGLAEISAIAAGKSSYTDAIAFSILFLVLLIKPTGLLGRPIQKKV
ncbi:branched-chain amino acid ABC transporter permease [Zhaonella formicivorans]|jgi:branched-chain amino acid transport system permease protein|uniref:branched-chain amino acid ABC transporter permease n=1 Tax=Zhaonella formicivorans TaxID=2528593 RepID=UPI0010ECAA2D|nr:branched-chain amino acid ABC transporter permease [Zhaonella formicivorans]